MPYSSTRKFTLPVSDFLILYLITSFRFGTREKVHNRRQESQLSPVSLVVCLCVCAFVYERNEVYILTGLTNIDFVVSSNTILNIWHCGNVRNLR